MPTTRGLGHPSSRRWPLQAPRRLDCAGDGCSRDRTSPPPLGRDGCRDDPCRVPTEGHSGDDHRSPLEDRSGRRGHSAVRRARQPSPASEHGSKPPRSPRARCSSGSTRQASPGVGSRLSPSEPSSGSDPPTPASGAASRGTRSESAQRRASQGASPKPGFGFGGIWCCLFREAVDEHDGNLDVA